MRIAPLLALMLVAPSVLAEPMLWPMASPGRPVGTPVTPWEASPVAAIYDLSGFDIAHTVTWATLPTTTTTTTVASNGADTCAEVQALVQLDGQHIQTDDSDYGVCDLNVTGDDVWLEMSDNTEFDHVSISGDRFHIEGGNIRRDLRGDPWNVADLTVENVRIEADDTLDDNVLGYVGLQFGAGAVRHSWVNVTVDSESYGMYYNEAASMADLIMANVHIIGDNDGDNDPGVWGVRVEQVDRLTVVDSCFRGLTNNAFRIHGGSSVASSGHVEDTIMYAGSTGNLMKVEANNYTNQGDIENYVFNNVDCHRDANFTWCIEFNAHDSDIGVSGTGGEMIANGNSFVRYGHDVGAGTGTSTFSFTDDSTSFGWTANPACAGVGADH